MHKRRREKKKRESRTYSTFYQRLVVNFPNVSPVNGLRTSHWKNITEPFLRTLELQLSKFYKRKRAPALKFRTVDECFKCQMKTVTLKTIQNKNSHSNIKEGKNASIYIFEGQSNFTCFSYGFRGKRNLNVTTRSLTKDRRHAVPRPDLTHIHRKLKA